MILVFTFAVLKFLLTCFAQLFCFTVSFSHLLSEFHGAGTVLLWCYAVGFVEFGLATAEGHGNNCV
jgi:hypothetical protein